MCRVQGQSWSLSVGENLEFHNVVVGAKQVIGPKVTNPLANNGKWKYTIFCGPSCNETSNNAILCKLLSRFSKEMNTDFI